MRNESRTVEIFRPGSRPPISLRKSERDGSLPVSKRDFLSGLSRLFNRGLQFSVEFKLRDVTVHWSEQGEIPGMGSPRFVTEDIPTGSIDCKRREAKISFAQCIEEELSEAIAATGLRDQQRIVRAAIGVDNITIKV